MKLNKKKCLFSKSEVIFLGHRITGEGIFPDKRKVEAVTNMPYPTNVTELQRLLGTVNYLGKFIPNLSTHTFNLRKLLEKDLLWCFENKHENEVDNLKQLITNSLVLKFYNPELPIKVSCDASMKGLGAVLEQKHHDIWQKIIVNLRKKSCQ